jgi:hypothetical protein
METLWKNLTKVPNGQVIVVFPENDQYIPTPQTANKMQTLAMRVNEKVTRISFFSDQPNPHRGRFYQHPSARTKVFKQIFAN